MASKDPGLAQGVRSRRPSRRYVYPRSAGTLAREKDREAERRARGVNYFTAAELACKCGRVECDAMPVQATFLAKLNMLRELWGRPLVVLSGCRCQYWNKEQGGALKSEHMRGNAADLRISSRMDADRLAELADKVGLLGIGIYKTWVHVDDGARRRWTG